MNDAEQQQIVGVREIDGGVVLSPIGDVDMSRSPALRDAIKRSHAASPGKLVVDLAAVGYMDSSGLATLVEAMKLCRGSGARLVLCAMNPRVRAIFEIAKLDQYFTIVENVDAAAGA